MDVESALSPVVIAQSIGAAYEAWLLRDRRPAMPHPTVWASSWRVCERRMVLELTVPDQQPMPDAPLLAKFRRGDDRERDLLADLARIGRDADPVFEVVGQQERFEIRGRTGDVVISGKVDARLKIPRLGISAPVEIKAWSQYLVDQIHTFEDVKANPFTRAGAFQLLAYQYASNQPIGFLVLDRSGLPLLIPVELDTPNLEAMEEFLSRAERVVAHRNAGTLPDYYTDDPAECNRCPFYGSVCNPPLLAKSPDVLIDPDLEAHLERWHALRATGKEWEALDRDLKKRFRGVESAIVGHFVIAGRWGKQSRLEVPPEVKAQYTTTDPKGRFTVEIERL
jgi:hypothetical protein